MAVNRLGEDNRDFVETYVTIGGTTASPARVFEKASGEFQTPDGDTWTIIEKTAGGCIAKSTLIFAEAKLFVCYSCPNRDDCELD